MKRISFTLIVLFVFACITSAQTADHAIGLRFGAGDAFGTEISYQHGLTAFNRLELDLGFSNHHQPDNYYNSWGLTGLYHWVWKLDQGLNWYAGPGAKIGGWSHNQNYNHLYDNGLFLAAAGDIGIEYIFPVKIQLALNARPELGLINHGSGFNVGFAVRYQF